MDKSFKVKKSRLPDAGKGLFTTVNIKKGALIVEYLGEKLTWAEAVKRYKNSETMGYVFHISPKNCIDAQNTPNELARYANDANATLGKNTAKNNAEYQIVKRKAYIVATKSITAGEEILVDYGDDYWEKEEEEKVVKKKKKSTKKGKKKKAKK